MIRSQKGITGIEIAVGLTVFFILFTVVMIFLNRNIRLDFPTCGVNTIVFVHHLIDPDDYDELLPLGRVNPLSNVLPSSVMTINRNKLTEGRDQLVPLYMPGNGWITKIRISDKAQNGTGESESEYSIYISMCDEVSISMQNVEKLSDSLNKLVDDSNCVHNDYNNSCEIELHKPIPFGKEIGAVGVYGEAFSIDVEVHDSRSNLLQSVVELDDISNDTTVVCPINYFHPDLIDKIEDKLPELTKQYASKEFPLCGNADMDIQGSARGVWFTDNPELPIEQRTIALGYDVVKPQQSFISIGSSMEAVGVSSGKYAFNAQGEGYINRPFDDVTELNTTYCYHNFEHEYSGSIILQLLDESTLEVGVNTNENCDTYPTQLLSETIQYYR